MLSKHSELHGGYSGPYGHTDFLPMAEQNLGHVNYVLEALNRPSTCVYIVSNNNNNNNNNNMDIHEWVFDLRRSPQF